MSAKMTDLPTDIASMITNNLKHDPVYLIKYKKILSSIDDDNDELTEIDQDDYVKLVTLVGGPDDSEYICEGMAGLYDNGGIFSKLKNSPYLPAYVRISSSIEKPPPPLADLLKPWTVITMQNHADMIIIKEFTRYA